MLPLLKYTVLRLALFIGALWVLSIAGASPLIALLGAAVVSFLLSYLLLRGPREQLAEQVAGRIERRRTRHPAAADPDAAIEDAVVDHAAADKTAADRTAADD